MKIFHPADYEIPRSHELPFQLPFRAVDFSSSSYAVELPALTDTNKHLLLTCNQDTVDGAIHVMSV